MCIKIKFFPHRAQADSNDGMHIDNAILLPQIVTLLNEGHTVTLNLKGFSMRPFLENNRDKALLTKPTNPKVGDPVLAETAPKHFVLHRIIRIDGDAVTLRGDGNLGVEHCKITDVCGAVIGFYRKGRQTLDRTDGLKWRVYSWIWTRLYPIRRYLLAVYHKILLPLTPNHKSRRNNKLITDNQIERNKEMKTKPGFNIRNVCGQDLIVAEGEENIDFSSIISMNETSSYLWQEVQKMDNFTIDDMADLILKEYDTDRETALKDCETLAAQWAKAGIIEGADIPKVEIEETKVESNQPATVAADAIKPAEEKPKKQGFFGRLFHKKD